MATWRLAGILSTGVSWLRYTADTRIRKNIMKPIPFFDDHIRIAVHSASDPQHVNTVMTIQEFAHGDPVGLYETDDGELKVILFGAGSSPYPQIFIEGPEA